MEHVPPLNQGDADYCYAYVAAEMMDAYRFSHGDKDYSFLSSPIPPALETGLNREQPEAWKDPGHTQERFGLGGDVCPVIANYFSGKLVCSSKSVVDRYSGNLGSLLKEIEQSELGIDTPDYSSSYAPTTEFMAYLEKIFYQGRANSSCQTMLSIEHQLNVLDFATFAPSIEVLKRLLSQPDPVKFVEGVETNGCLEEKPKKLPFVHCKSEEISFTSNGSDATKVMADINHQLEEPNAQPVAINYNPMIYDSRTSLNDLENHVPGGHASLIIGRRRIAGKCQYLIRNSYGLTCKNVQNGCVNGNIWVTENRLNKAIDSIYWIE